MNLLCSECYPLNIGNCSDTFKIPVGFPPGTIIWGTITDKFGNEFRIKANVDSAGEIELDKTKFPPGLFTPYSGFFTFVVNATGESEPQDPICENETITICGKEYTCVIISVVNRAYSDHTTAEAPICICGYAFGTADYQVEFDNVNGMFRLEGFPSSTQFMATGNLVNVEYRIDSYQLDGTFNETVSQTAVDGDHVLLETPLGANSFWIRITATFDDGAMTTTSLFAQYVRGWEFLTTTEGEEYSIADCNSLSIEVSEPTVTTNTTNDPKTFNPGFYNGSYELLTEGDFYNDAAPYAEGWQFDFAFSFGVVPSEWNLPENSGAGIAMKFVACPE